MTELIDEITQIIKESQQFNVNPNDSAKAILDKFQPVIEQARQEERNKLWGELEDIRCNASGDYLPGIERLMESLLKAWQ